MSNGLEKKPTESVSRAQLIQVGRQVFADAFKEAGYDTDVPPIYALALTGMVTLVGQWWSVLRKPSVEKVASHIAALASIGPRNSPEKPDPIGVRHKRE